MRNDYPTAAWSVGLGVSILALVAVGLLIASRPVSVEPTATTAPRIREWVEVRATTTAPRITELTAPADKSDKAVVAATTTTTTTTVPPAPVWKPADECADVPRSRLLQSWRRGSDPWTSMRWCPVVAKYLYQGQQRGLWRWEPGDLTRLMVIMHCESAGSTTDPNPSSTAYGLYQFLDSTWKWMVRINAHGRMGFDNPNRHMAYDQIAMGVYLFKTEGRGQWPNCGRW